MCPLARRLRNPLQASTVSRNLPQHTGEDLHIPTRKQKSSFSGRNQVPRRAHVGAGRHDAAAEHRLVHNYPEGFVFGGEHEQVRGRVYGWQPRLVDKTEQFDPAAHAHLRGFRFHLLSEWPFSRKDKNGPRQVRAGKRTEQIERALPRLELRAKERHEAAIGNAP